MTALEKLRSLNSSGKFFSVGLDTEISKIPAHLKSNPNPVLEFNRLIIEATKDMAAAYKINLAFYEAEGKTGIENIEKTLSLIPDKILTIADGKRADIGNTSKMYARAIFEQMHFDSTTLNPYLGEDSLAPFLNYNSKLNFILALTSNSGSVDFQKLELKNNMFLYEAVIQKVIIWNSKKNCGIVFGATNAEELENSIDSFGELPVLLPGIGVQGGNLERICEIFSKKENNLLINVSRGVIYKDSTSQFDKSAREELFRLNEVVKSNLSR